MKTLFTLFLLLAVAVVLSGCGHYGMGHRYTNDMHYDQNRTDSQYMQGNGIQSNGPYMR
jgi:outer membrane lipopolysaccharide assembly protein LptE/RlpB